MGSAYERPFHAYTLNFEWEEDNLRVEDARKNNNKIKSCRVPGGTNTRPDNSPPNCVVCCTPTLLIVWIIEGMTREGGRESESNPTLNGQNKRNCKICRNYIFLGLFCNVLVSVDYEGKHSTVFSLEKALAKRPNTCTLSTA